MTRGSFIRMLALSLIIHGGGVVAASNWSSSPIVVPPATALKISMRISKPQPQVKQQPVQTPPEPPKPKIIETKQPEPIAKQRPRPLRKQEVVRQLEQPKPAVEQVQPLPPQPENNPPVLSVAYEQALAALLEKNKFYPRRARRRRLEGDGVIQLKIAKSGKLLESVVTRSTGSAVLDRAIEEIVERAQPLPPLPVEYHPSTMTVKVPLSFALKE